MTITNFADILHLLTPEEFFRDHHGKKPVHIPGSPDKLASLIDRETLSDLLGQKDIWTGALLMWTVHVNRSGSLAIPELAEGAR